MALKTSVYVEVEKNEQKYVFHMPYGRPLQECYDAAQEVCNELVEFSKALAKAEEDKKKAEGSEEAPADKGEGDGKQQN